MASIDTSRRPPNYESDIEFEEDGVELEEAIHGEGVYGRAVRRGNQRTSGDQEDVGYAAFHTHRQAALESVGVNPPHLTRVR